MTLDVSQFAVIIASAAVTLITTIIGYQLKKYFKRQEEAVKRREAKQELHFRKLDAVIFALASSSENISGEQFKKAYEERLKAVTLEDQMMGALE